MELFKKSSIVNQGDNNHIIQNYGPTYEDIKAIALDVYKANFYQLSPKANPIAYERAEHFTENFLRRFYAESPQLVNKLEEPSVQSSIFEVQKECAKAGDIDLEKILIELLLQRIEADERSLKQIILAESLLITPKLVRFHLDALTLIFYIKNSFNSQVINLEELRNHFNLYSPYIEHLTDNYQDYLHLEYTGCCVVRTKVTVGIPDYFVQKIRSIYSPILPEGFTEDNLKDFLDSINIMRRIKPIYNTVLRGLDLTSVGKAIAQANFINRSNNSMEIEL